MVGLGLNADFDRIGPCRFGVWGDIETQFVDEGSSIQVDLNVTPYYDIGKVELFAGFGISLERQSFDNSESFTETGFNTIIGAKYDAGFVNPFARFRCTFFDGFDSDFRHDTLFGGLMIALGGF